MANVEKFKYWCNKILPLVYDDSLSYYEFLGKVYEKLNETIDAVNSNTEAVAEFDQRINDFIAAETAAREGWEDQQERDRQSWETQQAQKWSAFQAMFISEYDPDDAYVKGDLCSVQYKMYVANASTTGTFDPKKWDEIVLSDYLAEYVNTAAAAMQAQYDRFLADYQRSFGVVQGTGTSTTDVMSQDAVTKTIRSETVPPVGANLYLGNLLLNWIDNRYLNDVTGNLNNNPAYAGCDFFPVSPSTQYRCKGLFRVGFYDSDKQFISALSPIPGPIITTPANAAFARADLIKSENVPITAFFGTLADYEKKVYIKNLTLPIEQSTGTSTTGLMSQKATTDAINTTADDLKNELSAQVSTNLYLGNLLSKWIDNRYLNDVTGNLNVNPAYAACDFFPISPSTQYRMKGLYRLGFYDSDKQFISALSPIPVSIVTTPANAAFARADLLKAENVPITAFFGTLADYEKEVYIKKLALPIEQSTGTSTTSIMSQKAITDAINAAIAHEYTYLPGVSIVRGNLSTGNSMTFNIDNVKKNCQYAFSCNISSFTSLSIGHGKTAFESAYITVDETNLYVNRYRSSLLTVTIPHGLTIDKYIKCTINVNQNGLAVVEINTNGQTFKTTTAQEWGGSANAAPFAECVGSLTNCCFTYARRDSLKDLWAFGDSYFGINSADRWCYYLIQNEYYNSLLNAYAGENSNGAVTALQTLLTVAKPKQIVWALGMNDGSDSGDTPSATWLTNLQRVISLCTNNNINLILATVPTVPSVNNEAKNNYIKSSGYRYIDFASAVGANASGVWYSGMLDVDAVHPTVLGAKELFRQAINDCPEFTY